MDELKSIVAKNIIRLRTSNHLTQFELGEKINYSDKAISKWERAEAVPDAFVLLQLGKIFNVSVDYLLSHHSESEKIPAESSQKRISYGTITLVAFIGVWSLALLAFVILVLFGKQLWVIFAVSLPVSLVVLLIFNTLWGNGKRNFYIISGINWSVLLTIYLSFFEYNWWPLFALGVPAQIITFLCFRIIRKN